MADYQVKVMVDKARLEQAIRQIPDLLEAVLEKAGRDVEASAKRIIIEKDIIDTGLTLSTTQSRHTERRFEREVGPTTLYAPFLELGTSRIAARPFMLPALSENERAFQAAIQAAMEKLA